MMTNILMMLTMMMMMVIGDVVEAVRHARAIQRQIRVAQSLDATELYNYAKELRVPVDLLIKTSKLGRLPVVNFAAGGLGEQPHNLHSQLKMLKI